MYQHILVPVAFEYDGDGDGDAAVEVAMRLRGDGGAIHLLHVLEEIPSFVASSVPDSVVQGVRSDAEARLTKAAEGLPGAVVTDLIFGRANHAIVDYAKNNAVDCIVIRSHQPKFEDYLIGSTAAHVARHATCAVHILR